MRIGDFKAHLQRRRRSHAKDRLKAEHETNRQIGRVAAERFVVSTGLPAQPWYMHKKGELPC